MPATITLMAGTAKTTGRRPRHDPRETEREILEAAEALLRECPVREMTVEQVMARTGLKRTAFYAHFQDRHELLLRVVADLGARLFAMADRWLQGVDPERDVIAAIEGVAEVYMTDGPVLRALADAAVADERVELAYRGLVQAFVGRHRRAHPRRAGSRADRRRARCLGDRPCPGVAQRALPLGGSRAHSPGGPKRGSSGSSRGSGWRRSTAPPPRRRPPRDRSPSTGGPARVPRAGAAARRRGLPAPSRGCAADAAPAAPGRRRSRVPPRRPAGRR